MLPGLAVWAPNTDTVDASATRQCMTGRFQSSGHGKYESVEPSDDRSFRIRRGRSAAAADSAEFKRLR